ncbi:MAG: retropepsin-like aspartic protease [Marinifilaceae bacterium]|jgi:predicted aspartyl protease
MLIEVPFEVVELEKNSYHLFVKCKLNGEQYGDLVIDTGASKTVLDRNFVDQYRSMEKEEESVQSSGLGGGKIDTEMVEVSSLQIGDLEVFTIRLALIDLSEINQMYEKYCNRKISGLLGSDFLLQHQACIDYHRKRLVFRNSD